MITKRDNDLLNKIAVIDLALQQYRDRVIDDDELQMRIKRQLQKMFDLVVAGQPQKYSKVE